MLQSLRTLVTSLAIASVVGTVTQAYTSSASAQVASGTQVVTAGIAVQAVDYQVASGYLRAVTFRTAAYSATVSIRLRQDGEWTPCSNSSGKVSCELPANYPASAVERLEISAR